MKKTNIIALISIGILITLFMVACLNQGSSSRVSRAELQEIMDDMRMPLREFFDLNQEFLRDIKEQLQSQEMEYIFIRKLDSYITASDRNGVHIDLESQLWQQIELYFNIVEFYYEPYIELYRNSDGFLYIEFGFFLPRATLKGIVYMPEEQRGHWEQLEKNWYIFFSRVN